MALPRRTTAEHHATASNALCLVDEVRTLRDAQRTTRKVCGLVRLDELAGELSMLDRDAMAEWATQRRPIPTVFLRVNGVEQACLLVHSEPGKVILEAR